VNEQRIPTDERRRLARGDVISFGGGEYVRCNGARLLNPFRFVLLHDEEDGMVAPAVGSKRQRDSAPDTVPQPATRARTSAHALIAEETAHTDTARNLVAEELKCSVCIEWMVHPHALACSHNFCCDCLSKWFSKSLPHKASCPICRAEVTSMPAPCSSLNNIISTLVDPILSPSERAERTERVVIWKALRVAAKARAARHRGRVPGTETVGGGAAGSNGSGTPAMALSLLHHLIRTQTANLDVVNNTLRERLDRLEELAAEELSNGPLLLPVFDEGDGPP
jgi:hypothetical protein